MATAILSVPAVDALARSDWATATNSHYSSLGLPAPWTDCRLSSKIKKDRSGVPMEADLMSLTGLGGPRPPGQRAAYYDVALICENGHTINGCYQGNPERNSPHCPQCGQPTIHRCPECGTPIRGDYVRQAGFSHGSGRPAFCRNCGKPYPWTERARRVALELFLEEVPDDPEQAKQFEETIDDLIADGPRTALAATRMKKFLVGHGQTVAGAMKDVLIDVVGEAVKRLLWPQ